MNKKELEHMRNDELEVWVCYCEKSGITRYSIHFDIKSKRCLDCGRKMVSILYKSRNIKREDENNKKD